MASSAIRSSVKKQLMSGGWVNENGKKVKGMKNWPFSGSAPAERKKGAVSMASQFGGSKGTVSKGKYGEKEAAVEKKFAQPQWVSKRESNKAKMKAAKQKVSKGVIKAAKASRKRAQAIAAKKKKAA